MRLADQCHVSQIVTPIYVAFTIELQGFGINNPIALLAILLSQFAFLMSNLTLLHLGKQEFNRIDCQEVIRTGFLWF